MAKFLLLLRSENTEEENQYYIRAIEEFNGEVVFVHDTDSYDYVLKILNGVSGILLPGGCDVGRLDYFLIEFAVSHQLRLFGICQGMQSMALWKSCNKLISIGDKSHHQKEEYAHFVLLKDSRLRQILGISQIRVNSFHYQTVLDSNHFTVIGMSSDGLVEAVEDSSQYFQIGVQWHPERMITYDDASRKVFLEFVK